MTDKKHITGGQHQGKLVLQSREALAGQWLDAQITYLNALHDSAENLRTILDGLEESGMSALTLEPLRDAVEGLDHSLTLQRLEALRTTTHEGTMRDAARTPKLRDRLGGALNSPKLFNAALAATAQRMVNDPGADVQAVEQTVPLLRSEMNKIADAYDTVLIAQTSHLANTALADAADLSRK